ncbi:putative integral membrane protein, Mpv17/PMP22 family [Aureobasidium sp. EXF-8845]|nr:putative integral membrane protein, Mpv17/PMP22 family [Aureobasidium sp. EXF-8845]
MASFMRWYGVKLAQRPMLTQSVTTAVLFATGDTMAQQGVEQVGLKNHDLARSARMALYGGAIFGPLATTWFGFLQRRVRIPGSPNAEILARVGLDQTVLAPLNLFAFLSSMAIMEGSDPQKKIESTYWNALSKNWMLWPFVQAVNFKFVPLQHRVLLVNFVSLGWNCYLSYLNSTGSPIPKELPPS